MNATQSRIYFSPFVRKQMVLDVVSETVVIYAGDCTVLRLGRQKPDVLSLQFLRHLVKQDGSLYLGPLVDTIFPLRIDECVALANESIINTQRLRTAGLIEPLFAPLCTRIAPYRNLIAP
jgi:hypothetical protein